MGREGGGAHPPFYILMFSKAFSFHSLQSCFSSKLSSQRSFVFTVSSGVLPFLSSCFLGDPNTAAAAVTYRIIELEDTYKDHLVQLPNHFRANQK